MPIFVDPDSYIETDAERNLSLKTQHLLYLLTAVPTLLLQLIELYFPIG